MVQGVWTNKSCNTQPCPSPSNTPIPTAIPTTPVSATPVISNTPPGKVEVVNPGFENGTANWWSWDPSGGSFTPEATDKGKSAKVTLGATPCGALCGGTTAKVSCINQGRHESENQSFWVGPLFQGKQFNASYSYKTTAGVTTAFQLALRKADGSYYSGYSYPDAYITGAESVDKWTDVSKTFTIPAAVENQAVTAFDISLCTSSANSGAITYYDNVSVSALSTGLTVTPTVPVSPSPTLNPTLTSIPVSGSQYTIDIGNHDPLTINIMEGTGVTNTPVLPSGLPIKFQAKLTHLGKNPDLWLKLRIIDEEVVMKSGTSTNSQNTCNNPLQGMNDYYIPVKSANNDGIYSPDKTANPSTDVQLQPPSGAQILTVASDGSVQIPAISGGSNKFYTFILKGPKTRGVKMTEHYPDASQSSTFDWTRVPLDAGDLPDSNNDNKQDCTINSIDVSQIVSRFGQSDPDSVKVCDVDYNGICNGQDISTIITNLQNKPDDD